ncbi:hypothetical protein QR680_015210 [Steinernema hermaphroditum]|uniref:Helicase C-terminal domain-containing protein n=1 Tax=Steinernema hermaphroditum TaxID=289476 RepID=A0AA39IE56_9BILA|nr:hypothetical protein QR680_015210 [Steinernema hermaphroditum]
MGDKCVIVSQWTSMLNIVERHLKRRDVCYTSITGAIPTEDRQARVDSFNVPDGEGTLEGTQGALFLFDLNKPVERAAASSGRPY